MFDCDANKDEQLEEATKLATKNNILLIFSNPCFEYWILCHYEYSSTKTSPNELIGRLKEILGSYKKNDPDIYTKTRDKISQAKKHAEKIIKEHEKQGIKLLLRASNPSTNVYKLLRKIDEFRR